MVTTIAIRNGKVYQVWEDVLCSEPVRLRRFWLLPGLDPEWVKEGEPVTELGSGAVCVVYRSHCRELCDRLAAGADTRPATAAEVLLGLSGASLKAPPGRDAGTLQARCFLEVMGTPADKELAGILEDMAGQRESFPGQFDEMMGEIRRKLRQDWRKRRGGEPCGQHW